MSSILLTNLRSINNKYDELRCHVLTQSPDILVCTETWLSSATPESAFNIGGYNCFRTDRFGGSRHGGVAVWIKSHFRAQRVPFFLFEQAEVCVVQLASVKLLCIGIYLPPGILSQSFGSFCERFTSYLDDVLMKFPHHRLIVAGDFNQYDRTFLTTTFSLVNIVNEPTRLNASLDQIFVDKDIAESLPEYHVEIGPPIGTSDHCTVYAKFEDIVSDDTRRKRIFYDMRQSHVIEFERRFVANDFHAFYTEEDINKKCELFYDFLYDALQVILSRTIYLSEKDAQWMTPFIKHLINSRWEAYRSKDWALYNSLKSR